MTNPRNILAALVALACMACSRTVAPEPVRPVPMKKQVEWQKMETYAFVHFNMNTFTDAEWGYGDTPAVMFNPTALDCNQWAATCAAAGLKGIILTAKHHDGFCLWPSKYTGYSVKNSPWKNGQGDVVRDLASACRKYGLKMGLYLSPWDRNHPEYGNPEYVDYFHNQLIELLSNYGEIFEIWFDGANGGDGYYGGASEMRTIDREKYYRFDRVRQIIDSLQPNAVYFADNGQVRWVGNESGRAGETNWSTLRSDEMSPGTERYNELTYGHIDGTHWSPAECDVSIRPGWYYHPWQDNQVKSLPQLVDIYYKSVGRNASLLLNLPVDRTGRINPIDSTRLMEWHAVIAEQLKYNLFADATVSASNVRGDMKRFQASRATDRKWDTYWATDDKTTSAGLTVRMPAMRKLNRLLLQEYIPLGQRVEAFSVEYFDGELWRPVTPYDSTTTIGYKRILRFAAVETDKIRVNITASKGAIVLCNVEAYLAPELVMEPSVLRNAHDQVVIIPPDRELDIHYTTDGSTPTTASARYTAPFDFSHRGTVKAIAVDANFGTVSPVAERTFDIPVSGFSLLNYTKEASQRVFDSNPGTYIRTKDDCTVTLDLGLTVALAGLTYLPNQRSGTGASGYLIETGPSPDRMTKAAEGEFPNIENNPAMQQVDFGPVECRYVRFTATSTIRNTLYLDIAELGVVTHPSGASGK